MASSDADDEAGAEACARERVVIAHEGRLDAIEARLADGHERMGRIESGLEANSAATFELLELMRTLKAGFKVLGWFGVVAKWVGYMAGAATAIWTLVQVAKGGGQPPQPGGGG